MNEQMLRESLKACLSDSVFPAERQREVLERIQAAPTTGRRRLSYVPALAVILTLLMGALAVAAGFGLFGTFTQRDYTELSGEQLERLDEAAEQLEEQVSLAAPQALAMPEGTRTLREALAAHQQARTFDLTLNQAYCDGKKLYYSYTLKTNVRDMTFGEGKPSGFDSWEWEEPGKTFKDVWWIDPQETTDQITAWLDGEGARYVVIDSMGVGDGCALDDGSEKGLPLNIYASDRVDVNETTIQGYQEVELPEGFTPGDAVDILMSVHYSTTVYYQDETGVYRSGVRQEENRGILRVPFTIPVTSAKRTLTGSIETDAYAAEATLTVSDVSVYGEVVFDAPEWAAAFNADADMSSAGFITGYTLVAGGETLRNREGGFGVDEDGRFMVMLEYDLPASLDNLVLRPSPGAHEGDEIRLR